jgi:parallel beta helix pectate lyase-like protein
MKRLNVLLGIALVVGLALFAGPALATDLTCDVLSGNECQITTLHNLGAGGTFTTPAGSPVLHIIGPAGELRTNAGSTLTLNIEGASPNGLVIELGGKITGNTTGAAGVGATININVAAGNVLLAELVSGTGATISAANTAGAGCNTGHGGVINLTANGFNATITTEDGTVISVSGDTCPAGAINIAAPNQGTIDIDGNVLAESTQSGSGTANSNSNPPVGGTQRPGGGPIFITASCDLTVSDTGFISSKGKDSGADLVHLQGGCDVLINGVVQSTGAGHAIPGNPPNSCSDVIPHTGSVRRNPATRPDKNVNSTGCIEVWAGNSLTINAASGAELNADVGDGGSNGTSWIDLFARGNIAINGDAGTYAVHANELAQTNGGGGDITVKSRDGKVTTGGNALQAGDGLSNGSKGGNVVVEAGGVGGAGDIVFGTASIQALADGSPGATGTGGTITAKSFNGQITGSAPGALDTREAGAAGGVITLTACAADPALTYTGTEDAATVNNNFPFCGGTVQFQPYVVLPDCPCQALLPPVCEKATVQAVLNPFTGRFPNNFGPDVTVRLDLGQKVQDAVDSASDSNGDGYILILVVKDGTGQLGGSTSENVLVSKAYDHRFGLLACSVTINALDASKPAGRIASGAASPVGSPENIFVMDLHGAGSSGVAGWKVEGDDRYMRNVATKDSAVGMWFAGNNNTMHNGNAVDNAGVGIQVDGSFNKIETPDSFGNGGCGIQVTGNSNTVAGADVGDRNKGNGNGGLCVTGDFNVLSENDVFANTGTGISVAGNSNQLLKNNVGDVGDKGNSGDGIDVTGDSNKLSENDVYNSGGDGVTVTGKSNQLLKNVSGDKGKGNVGDGFRVVGAGNTLQENKASANGGDGFDVSGGTSAVPGANSLKSNQSNTGSSGGSGENTGAEYKLLNFVKNNGGGNKADGTTVPTAAKCPTFPATNATVNFLAPAVCE